MSKKIIAILMLISCTKVFAQDINFPAQIENQYIADQGDGTFINPVLAGRYPDPSVIRVGSDYYMTHGGNSIGGLIIWHSRDLINWKPLTRIELENYGQPWAPDLVYADGMFFIYVTMPVYLNNGGRSFDNVVMYADRITGPWSDPIDLKVNDLIDPGHLVTRKGDRYLFFSKGMLAKLNDTGDEIIEAPIKVYDGWEYPEEWIVECPCLESPKLFYKDKYYYMVSAMGGTAGPSTSHMAIVARAEKPEGPWENSPYNPLIRTKDRSEKWWSTGHATLIDDREGKWWGLFHGYENSYRNLGRQTLLLPVEWTEDGWPFIPEGITAETKIVKPFGDNIGHGMALSDAFITDDLGIQWGFPTNDCKCNFMSGGGQLQLIAHSQSVKDGALTAVVPVNKAYEASVLVQIDPATEGGLVFYGDNDKYSGIGIRQGKLVLYNSGVEIAGQPGEVPNISTNELYLKIMNFHHDLVFYYSTDGIEWTKLSRSLNDISLQRTYVALYGFGSGSVIFKDFKYKGL